MYFSVVLVKKENSWEVGCWWRTNLAEHLFDTMVFAKTFLCLGWCVMATEHAHSFNNFTIPIDFLCMYSNYIILFFDYQGSMFCFRKTPSFLGQGSIYDRQSNCDTISCIPCHFCCWYTSHRVFRENGPRDTPGVEENPMRSIHCTWLMQ